MSRSRSNPGKAATVVSVLGLILLILFLAAAPVAAAGTIRVDWDAPGCKTTSGQADPYAVVYCKISTAVQDATPGDTIHVYPGTYPEGVDLKDMVPPVNISLVTVNEAGTPTPGTATVYAIGLTSPGIYALAEPVTGTVTIDGFNVLSGPNNSAVNIYLDGNVTIRNVMAFAAAGMGHGIDVHPANGGTVTIANCVANSNASNGISVQGYDFSGQQVNITNCMAVDNGNTGIEVTSLDGNVYIANCTAKWNEGGGISVINRSDGSGGSVAIENCTANGNSGTDNGNGIMVNNASGGLGIFNCVARDNGRDGICLPGLSGSNDRHVNGGIICGNTRFGLSLSSLVNVDATANWWGCPDGPGGAGCDTIGGAGADNVTRDPWIDTVTPSVTVDPVTAGEATVVSFQFSDTSVYLGQGPGDLHGMLPFNVSTDNGTLNGVGPAVQAGINNANGVLSVTLVPETSVTATVTLDGPCGLGDLDGTEIDVGVLERPSGGRFVPEPGALALLGSGLMGLAGYAGLRLRRR